MRIIAGEFRSRVLVAPKGMETRPTSDRLRETLFNVLAPRLAGSRFLDLYAGSGANGLEALSRGAQQAVFVEQASPAIAAIRTNITSLGVQTRARIEPSAVRRWLIAAAQAQVGAFEILFVDPPYTAAEEYAATLQALGGEANNLVSNGGVVVVEHRRLRAPRMGKSAAVAPPLEPRYGALQRFRTLDQGDASLSFFRSGEILLS
jgi:16S rRNA (guanine(966)-N(2))-methyltransferase RsmD